MGTTRRRRRALQVTAATLGLVAAGATWAGPDPTGTPTAAVADADRSDPGRRPPAELPPTEPPLTAPPTEAAPTVPPSTEPSTDPPDGPVTLNFAGDVHAEGPSGDALQAGLPTIRDLLGRADLTVLNLETAITERGTPADKEFVFRAPASTMTSLRQAGVDVVTMANNHGLDFGQQGLADSLAAEQATGLPVVGVGEDEVEAYAPYTAEVRGQRIAVLGATQVLDSALEQAWTAGPDSPGMASAKQVPRLLAEVRRARQDADTVVVYLHWGQERDPCPLPRQQELARLLVDAGADVVVGAHAHVLLGGGMLDGAYVDYGLGNFVFGARSDEAARTGVLTLTLAGREVMSSSWSPAVLRNGRPLPLGGADAAAAVADKERRRSCTDLTAPPGPPQP